MPRSSRAPLAVGLGTLALLLLGLFVALRLEVTSDITHFLPDGSADAETAVARELLGSELSRTMVLVLEAGSSEAAVRAGRAFERELRADPRVAGALAFLDGGPAEGLEEALWTLHRPRQLAFFAPDAAAVAAATTPEALRASVARLKRQLATPMSSLLTRVAPDDPTLVLPRLLERLAAGPAEGLRVADGRFVSASGHAAVLFLGTNAPATDSRVQAPLLAGVHAAFARVAAAEPGPLALATSGANRFAVRAEEASKDDLQRVSLGASLGVGVLLFALFRSFRLAFLVLPVIAAAFLAGTAACLLAFGAVHGLTLAFGGAMIGVSVDHAVHFYCHQTLAPDPRGPRHTLARLWGGLALSTATTVVGFGLLLFARIAGLRELGLFAAVSMPSALLATRLFLPALAGTPRTAPPARRLARALGAVLARPRARWLLAVPAVCVAALAVVGLPRARWSDGLANLRRLDPDLQREEEHVRAQVGRYEQRRLVLALGAGEEQALQVNDAVAVALARAQEQGHVGGFRTLATLLPSAARQREVAAAVRAEPELWPRLAAALQAEGFDVAGFEPFRARLEAGAEPEPLRFADLEASALGALARPFRVHLGDQIGVISFLHELRDEPALRAALAAIPGARLVDVEAVLGRAYRTYREHMLGLLLGGGALVIALVALRHRRLRPTLAACLPAVLSVAGTVALVALAGLELDLLGLMALLMVVCMGDDYGVLLAEEHGARAGWEATQLALFVAGATTVLGFALLAFSAQPALFEIGVVTSVGMALALVLAPSLSALLRPAPASP